MLPPSLILVSCCRCNRISKRLQT